MLFFGKFEHSLDNKYRVRIPSRLRDILIKNEKKVAVREEGDPYAYIARGNDGNLVILPASTIEEISDKIKKIGVTKETRRSVQVFLASIYPIDEDGQGRFTLNATLREFAGIKKDVVFVGDCDRITLWDRQVWEEYEKSCPDTEGLDIFGIY